MEPLSPTTISLGAAVISFFLLLAWIGHRRRWRDPVRFFTSRQKHALVVQAEGRCERKPMLWHRCRRPGTEADHVIPWSKGGPTQLWNGQLLCRKHNQRKSATLPGPIYRWRLQRRRTSTSRRHPSPTP